MNPMIDWITDSKGMSILVMNTENFNPLASEKESKIGLLITRPEQIGLYSGDGIVCIK